MKVLDLTLAVRVRANGAIARESLSSGEAGEALIRRGKNPDEAGMKKDAATGAGMRRWNYFVVDGSSLRTGAKVTGPSRPEARGFQWAAVKRPSRPVFSRRRAGMLTL